MTDRGRPPKYETPEEMQRIIDVYFLACRVNSGNMDRGEVPESFVAKEDADILDYVEDQVPTVSGIAYTLGMSTEAFRNYEQKDDFLATVKRAKQRVEIFLEQRLQGGTAAGTIFNLKNNFGWKDKTESEVTLKARIEDLSDEELDEYIRTHSE